MLCQQVSNFLIEYFNLKALKTGVNRKDLSDELWFETYKESYSSV